MLCDVCSAREAVVYQRHSGRALCFKCFREDLLRRVSAEVRYYRLFTPNDRILIAVSGGKDSFVLLDLIKDIHRSELIGIAIIDEGIEGYDRLSQAKWAIDMAEKFGMEVYITSFKDSIGFTLTELIEMAEKRGIRITPCTLCGIIKRRILNRLARHEHFDRVITAHNLNDEVQTIVMDILRLDLARLVQLHPLSPLLSSNFVRRVKPLRRIFEYEVTQYAFLSGFKFQEEDCPYIKALPSLRARIRSRMFEMEGIKPSYPLNIIEWHDRVVKKILSRWDLKMPELPLCPLCGEPMSYGRKYCALCELLMKLGVSAPQAGHKAKV